MEYNISLNTIHCSMTAERVGATKEFGQAERGII